MISQGSLIEYLDNGRFFCAFVMESSGKRLRLLNQNGRELNMPLARIVSPSSSTSPLNLPREELLAILKKAAEKRHHIAQALDLQEVWEIVCEEPEDEYSLEFLSELCFGDEPTDNQKSAFMRAVFTDRLFFKFKQGRIHVHSPEKVDQLRHQREKEKEREELLADGARALQKIMTGQPVTDEEWPGRQICLQSIRDYYLFGTQAENSEIGRELLKKANFKRPHDGYFLLIKAGIWQQHENLALIRAEIPTDFSEDSLRQTAEITESPVSELLADPKRQDFRELDVFTIDGVQTRDYDDALHVERHEDGLLVGIHIADVTHYIKPRDPLFAEAAGRGTSIYFPEGQLPMLPRELSQNVCSLIKGQPRPAMSFLVHLDSDGAVQKFSITPSIICVKRRLSYSEADAMMETDSDLATLNKLWKKLRKRRLENGALLLPFPDVLIHFKHNGDVDVGLSAANTPSRVLIAELMILTNTLAARYLADREAPGLFRSQPPPKKRVVFGEDTSLLLNSQQRKRLSRGELSTRCKQHSGLGVAGYTTVTSPIRRFLDLIILHQLNSMVRGKGILFSLEECKDFAGTLSQTLGRAGSVKQQRHRYWLLCYLERKVGKTVKALVINRGPKRINLLLTDCLLDVDLPVNPARLVAPGDEIYIRVERVSALDNTLRMGW